MTHEACPNRAVRTPVASSHAGISAAYGDISAVLLQRLGSLVECVRVESAVAQPVPPTFLARTT